MSDIFDFERPPALFAVMGNPVGHSRSPEIHQAFARQASVTIDYQRIQVDVGGFDQAVSNFQASGGVGLNVTLPFKVEAWELADQRTDRAERARAVNTVWFDGSLVWGDNTDGVGICRDITDNLGQVIQDRKILILGAGGAVRGVLGEVIDSAPAHVVIANRTVDKAAELAALYEDSPVPVIGCGFEETKGRSVDIIINGTAASLSGSVPPLPDLDLGADTLAYDMVYAQKPTTFMAWASSAGFTTTTDGLGMLVEQAAASFYRWHGFKPDTGPVITMLRG